MDAASRTPIKEITHDKQASCRDELSLSFEDVITSDAHSEADALSQRNLIESIAIAAVTTPLSPTIPEPVRQSFRDAVSNNPDWAYTMVGRTIGPYVLTARIGGTKTSEVFRATHQADLSQIFAVKLITNSLNDTVILRRFHAQRQLYAALSKLSAIVTFIDAGTTEDGYTYLVMQDVDGVPIDEYCDTRKLTIPARLKLFAQVCEAVQFAHQHAMIHRNLKPTNLLITAAGIPKLTDFGLVELIQPESNDEDGGTGSSASATLTGVNEPVLTPEYVSPEQVMGDVATTASDVYALGVVLYQLLSGHYPYRHGIRHTGEIFQAICEQVPEPPSVAAGDRETKIHHQSMDLSVQPASAATDQRPSGPLLSVRAVWPLDAEEIAAARGTTPSRLKRTLAGDLDAIVLMAMRKEPEWRYHSADQFRNDVARYLDGRPVLASAATYRYRTTILMRRHARLAVMGLFVVMALVVGAFVMSSQMILLRRERDRALSSSSQARQTVDQIVRHIDDEQLLKQSALEPLRKKMLQDTLHFYEDFLQDHSGDTSLRVEIAMAHTRVGEIRSLTGLSSRAMPEYERAVAAWERLVAEEPNNQEYRARLTRSLCAVGGLFLQREGQLSEALERFQRAQQQVEQLIPGDLMSASLSAELGMILFNIAEVKARQGHIPEAIELLERVLTLNSPTVTKDLRSIGPCITLARTHMALGKLLSDQPDQMLEALAAHMHAIELLEHLTQEHPDLADETYQLASEFSELSKLQQRLGEHIAALDSMRRASQILERITQLYPHVARYQQSLGTIYNDFSELASRHDEQVQALAFAQKDTHSSNA